MITKSLNKKSTLLLPILMVATLGANTLAISNESGKQQESTLEEVNLDSKLTKVDGLGDSLAKLQTSLSQVKDDQSVVEAEVIAIEKKKEEEKRKIAAYSSVPMDDAHKAYLIEQANAYGLDPAVLFGMIKVESNFNPSAKSKSSSASGYGQFIHSTAKYVYEDRLNLGSYTSHNLALDPYINIQMMANYLAYHFSKYGNYNQSLIRYNGGELGQRYADKVMAYVNSL